MSNRKHNPANERIKHDYLIYLKEAKRMSEASIDKAATAIDSYFDFTKHRDLKRFHRASAIAFKKHLAESTSAITGKPRGLSTTNGTLRSLHAFTIWLADQPGFKRSVSYSDAAYFTAAPSDSPAAGAMRSKPPPTLEQIQRVISLMPFGTDIEKRDRAIIAFAILTGARDAAIASLKIKHIDLSERLVFQDGREVKTKFRKSIRTYFFPVGGEAERIVSEWVRHLTEKLGFGTEEPLFPKTRIALGASGVFEASGVDRAPWSGAAAIRRVFRSAFARADLPYANPHSFRHTLALLGERLCQSPAEFKAWSQNLGHEDVLTTFRSYGTLPPKDQAQLIRGLGESRPDSDIVRRMRALLDGQAA